MTTNVFRNYDDLAGAIGNDLGTSRWLRIEQDMVDRFGSAVDDLQWIHCDPERARRESPFGGTIAHGMLILSLLSKLRDDMAAVRFEIPAKMGVFYGLNRVRFVNPVKVGCRIRVRLKINDARLVEPGVVQIVYGQTVEIENESRPALVAEAINRIYLA